MTAPGWVEHTWEGVEGWLWDGKLFVEKNYDPETGIAVFFIAPPGGRASVPHMAKGPRGFTPIVDPTVIVTEIEHDSPDPVTSSWAIIDPGDEETPPTIQETRTVRKAVPGDPGDFTMLDATDLVGSPLAGYLPIYVADTGLALGGAANSTPGALWTPPKIGGVYWPEEIASVADGDNSKTLCPIPIPPQPFAYWPEAVGQSQVTGTGPNVRVDIIARVGNEFSGNEVARAFGRSGVTPPTHVLVEGPPAGSVSTYGRVAVNTAATVFVRAERQPGSSDSFSIPAEASRYCVKVHPLP